MSLYRRLLLSYLTLVASFCAIFLLVAGSLYPKNRRPIADHPPGELPPPPTAMLQLALQRGGTAEMETVLRTPGLLFPPDAWITLHYPDGHHVVLAGDGPIGLGQEATMALAGNGTSRPGLGLSQTAPVRDLKSQVVAAISVEFGTPVAMMRLPLLHGQLLAVAAGLIAAALGTVVLAARFSSKVTRPVYAMVDGIREIEPSGLSSRLAEEGPEELRELSRSFNDLAGKLQEAMRELHSQKEQALVVADSRRQFLTDVSHNLRTPLTAVQGWLDALQDGMVSEQERPSHLDRMQREITHITRTISWLLDMARWEGGQPILRRETFAVIEVVMEVAQTLESAARAARVGLEFENLDPAWRVHADRARSREIFQILLENGVQHAGPDITLRLAMKPCAERLEVEVSDNGAGFDLQSGRLAQRLGLSIAERLVAAHGGQMTIESQHGYGTRVRFSLALAAPGQGEPEGLDGRAEAT